MNPKGAAMASDVEALASWISFGLRRGFLRPLEVHGFADGPHPSKRSLTMSPALIEALAARPDGEEPQ
jgi:hypothetical protein